MSEASVRPAKTNLSACNREHKYCKLHNYSEIKLAAIIIRPGGRSVSGDAREDHFYLLGFRFADLGLIDQHQPSRRVNLSIIPAQPQHNPF